MTPNDFDRIPTALPDEPTTQVDSTPIATGDSDATVRASWQIVDQQTVRITFEEVCPEDSSDGIPVPVEGERSATVAVATFEMHEALEVIVQLARRDRIPIDVMLTYKNKTTRIEIDDVLALTGNERVNRVPEANLLAVLSWKKFRPWFPDAVREAERIFFQKFDPRKATAIVFRLRAMAQEVAQHRQLPGRNVMVLRLE